MSASLGQPEGVAAAGRLLRGLLNENAHYRAEWRRRVSKARDGDLHQAAIARVLADRLAQDGLCREEDVEETARRLRNKVRRALDGSHLSAETLTLFISAFYMEEDDEQRLWAALAGTSANRGGISFTMRQERALARRQWHRTLSLFERYTVNANGCLVGRRTMQIIMAVEDGVDRYLFNHEPSVASIKVHAGGRLGAHYEYGSGLVADDIVLERPLQKGQRVALEYSTDYARDTVVTEVRRPARARSESVSLAVQFDPRRLPSEVWWSVWTDHYEDAPVQQARARLDEQGQAHQFVPYIEQTVVGFRWGWGPSTKA